MMVQQCKYKNQTVEGLDLTMTLGFGGGTILVPVSLPRPTTFTQSRRILVS